MRIKLYSVLFISVLAFVPAFAQAALSSNIVASGNYSAKTAITFQVNLSGLPADTSNLQTKISFVNTQASQVSGFSLNKNGTFVVIPLLQDGDNLTGYANYVAGTLNFKATFSSEGTYVFGYTIEDLSTTPAQTLTSSAYPIVIKAGQQVLGATVFSFTRNLSRGMRGEDVKELQKILQSAGFFNVDPTGYFGPITLQAVKDYQAAHGIPAIGLVGPLTRAELNK